MAATPPTNIAGFPTRVEPLEINGLALRLLVVDELDRYVDRDALLRDTAAAEPPYWAHLWAASRALASLVTTRGDWTDKSVVDVGCGLGLPGIVAAMSGASVIAFDVVPEALEMTRANAGFNRTHVSVARCDLRTPPFKTRFDVVLAADVTYDPVLHKALAAFLADALTADGLAWCAESVRTLDPGFRDACEASGLTVTESEVIEVEEGRAVPVRVSEVRRSPSFAGERGRVRDFRIDR